MSIRPPHRGFTLIELLVVISIISVLASVFLVALQGARQKSQVAAGFMFERHERAGLSGISASNAPIVYFDFNCATISGNTITSLVNLGVAQPSAIVTNFNNSAGVMFPVDTTLHGSGNFMQAVNSYPLRWMENTSYIWTALTSGTFTFSTWFNVNSGNCGGPGYCPLVATGYDAFSGTGIAVDAGLNNIIGMIGGTYVVTTKLPSKTQWMHIAFSVKKVGSVLSGVLYLNGQLVGMNNNITSSPNISGELDIGGNCCYGTFNTSNAEYDDVAFYDSSLAAVDIQRMYAEGLKTHPLAKR